MTIQTYCIYTLRYIRIRSIQLTHNIIYSFQQAKQSVENNTVSDYVQEPMWQLLTIFERLNKPEKCVFLVVFEPGNKLVTCNVQNLSNTQIYSACTHCDKQCILVLSFVSMYSYTKINRKKSFGHKIHNPAYIDLQQNGNVIKKPGTATSLTVTGKIIGYLLQKDVTVCKKSTTQSTMGTVCFIALDDTK